MTAYPDLFFDQIERGCLTSARVIVPVLLGLTQPKSIIDVGCGRGVWLSVFREHGVPSVVGLDGSYVDRSRLVIPEECFVPCDLGNELLIKGRYDLAVCLEVVEHLPPRAGPGLIRALTSAAPLVLFSAAIPGQGGTSHINEQWPSYWQALFRQHGFVTLDAIRPKILTDERVESWYRQNMVLCASEEAAQTLPALRRLENGLGLDWIHAPTATQYTTVRGLFRALPKVVKNAIKRRLMAHSEGAKHVARSYPECPR